MFSASLWNSVVSPGFTQEEVDLLRLALIKHGCGSWVKILHHFPFKKCFQLNIQTQRMFGQQSLREFNGLHLDPKIVLQKNALRENVARKNGMIIAKTSKEERMKAHEEWKKLEVSKEERAKLNIPIYVGSTPEVGVTKDIFTTCQEIEGMLTLAHRLEQAAYRKDAEEILEKRGGKGNVDAILEELRIERVKGYQQQLDNEEAEYKRLLAKTTGNNQDMDVEENAKIKIC